MRISKTLKTVDHNLTVFVNWFKVKNSNVIKKNQGFANLLIGPFRIQKQVTVDLYYKNKTVTHALLRKQHLIHQATQKKSDIVNNYLN